VIIWKEFIIDVGKERYVTERVWF